MLLCPIQNIALLTTDWIQKRPRITQVFGVNKDVYSQFGLNGHNGIDIGMPVGTPIFASMDGYCYPANDGDSGYGLHIKQRSSEKLLEFVYGHMSFIQVQYGEYVHMGDLIGLSGNTGFSTGPHLHFGARKLIKSDKDLLVCGIQNYDNGFKGSFDILPYLITWKGTLEKTNI
jgi:murein DD-endopeptidase MepM/ murein hydrolase activator NlpD